MKHWYLLSIGVLLSLSLVVLMTVEYGKIPDQRFHEVAVQSFGEKPVGPADEPVLRKIEASNPFVILQSGCFLMGHNTREDDERPPHRVCLSTFAIMRHEVTVEEYDLCRKNGGCRRIDFEHCNNFDEQSYKDFLRSPLAIALQKNHPIPCITWNEAGFFCEYLHARLPREAEWEYAARGSAGRDYPWGNQSIDGKRANYCDRDCRYSWRDKRSDDGFGETTAPVCSFPAGNTPDGLCDMAGNLWEWVEDWYSPDFYRRSPMDDPHNKRPTVMKALRGGGYINEARYLLSTNRSSTTPDNRIVGLGFRCVRGTNPTTLEQTN